MLSALNGLQVPLMAVKKNTIQLTNQKARTLPEIMCQSQ